MTLPLEGIKVLDIGRMAPGAYCTMVLGDLGADVLQVVEPGGGRRAQMERAAAQRTTQQERRNAAFSATSRNKRSMTLNLKHPEARKALYKLVETADVLIEGFRPGVVKRLEVDYDRLKKINPRLVYCSITGYGQDGPYQNLVGHDINYIATAGALGLIGQRDTGPVMPVNFLGDYAGGALNAVIGIMAALMARERTGRGQYVDISMTDGVLYLIAPSASQYLASGEVPRRGESRLTGGVPYYNAYETRDGKYISLGCNEPWFFDNLVKALGREEWVGHQWDTAKHGEMFSFFRETFMTRTRDDWFDYLRQRDIAVAKVYDMDEVFSDPQLLHRQMVVEAGTLDGETVRQVGIGPKLSDTPGSIRSLGPVLGQHTDPVLAELGYTLEQIQQLREQGAIG